MTYDEITFEACDKLNRKGFVRNIMHTIANYDEVINSDHALVISLDSAWGTGKTFLINMWKNMIDNNDSYKHYHTLYYNAWENDDWNEPFVPFFSCMKNEYLDAESDEMVKGFFEKSSEFLKFFGVGVAKNYLKKVAGEDAAELVGEALSKGAEKELEDDYCKNYLDYLEKKNNFNEGLNDLIPCEGKLLIFIDELDRCRPDYAIQTLEMIKHFFSNKNIVFIISVDMMQLSYSISTIYGQGMDSIGYLRRFIDMNFNIPKPIIDEFVEFKFAPIRNSEAYESLISNFSNKAIYLYKNLELSLRDIDKITDAFITFMLFYKNEIINHEEALEIYLYFFILKYKYPDKYNLIVHKDFTLEKEVADSNLPLLEHKFVLNGKITSLLKKLDATNDLEYIDYCNKEIDLFEIHEVCKSFEEHIEYVIEMFF